MGAQPPAYFTFYVTTFLFFQQYSAFSTAVTIDFQQVQVYK